MDTPFQFRSWEDTKKLAADIRKQLRDRGLAGFSVKATRGASGAHAFWIEIQPPKDTVTGFTDEEKAIITEVTGHRCWSCFGQAFQA